MRARERERVFVTPSVREGVGVREGVVLVSNAEGANRGHPADEAARFLVAKGEVGECDACLEMAETLALGSACSLAGLRKRADRVAAMPTGLIRRERQRADASG